MTTAETVLRAELTAAMRGRDRAATTALRTAIGALGNAEAVDAPAPVAGTTSEHVAGAHVGLGAAEAQRRELSDAEAWAVVRGEVDDLLAAADEVGSHGRADDAADLRAQADALVDVLQRHAPEALS